MQTNRLYHLAIVPMMLVLALPVNAALDEITVTARKKSEDLQDVPLQVDVVGGEDLTQLGINSLADVLSLSASLDFDTGFSPQDTRIVVRGLSPTRGRQNVAVLQDGIDISSEATRTAGGSLLINPRLFDMERVEVVKGPQNALYGRSAFNGAINYVTRRPDDELEIFAAVDVGDFDSQEFRGSVSGPITEGVSVGFAGAAWERDGFYTNPATNGELGGEEGSGVSLSATFNPTDALAIYARIEHTDDEFGVAAEGTIDPFFPLPMPVEASADLGLPGGPVLQGAANVDSVISVVGTIPDVSAIPITIAADPRTGMDFIGTERDISRASVIVDWQLNNLVLSSLTHVAQADVFQTHDGNRQGPITGGGFGFGTETWFESDTDLFSQEFRVVSEGNDTFNWTAGLLWWEEDATMLDGSVVCLVADCLGLLGQISPTGENNPAAPFVPRFPDLWQRDTQHWSAYGLADIALSDEWSVILEGRYVDEELDFIGPETQFWIFLGSDFNTGGEPIPSPTNSLFAESSDSYFLPKATLQWQRDDTLVYGAIGQSRKPSGFSTLTGGVGAFDPVRAAFDSEKLTVYEIGLKSEALDRKLRFNGAIFFQDFTDKQTTTQVIVNTLPVAKPINSAQAEVKGFEFDTTWLATERWTFSLNYTWLDSEYTDYTVLTDNPTVIAEAGNCAPEDLGGTSFCRVSYTGNDVEDVPDNAFALRAHYDRELSADWSWFGDMQLVHRSDRYDADTNIAKLASFTQVDLQLGLRRDNWTGIFYIDNMFRDETPRSTLATAAPLNNIGGGAVIPNLQIVSLTPPRVAGVRLNATF